MIDPQALAIHQAMTQGPPLNQLGVDGSREWSRHRAAPPPPADAGLEVSERTVAADPPVPVRLYRPVGLDAPPVVIFIHGGGWILGDLNSSDWACRRLANTARCAVVSVGYRLAPEHAYPAALDDCLAVLQWVSQSSVDLGVDGTRICVAGESSGGQLAATTCLAARDRGGAPVALQVLVCPMLDARMDTPSWHEFGPDFLPRAEQATWMWDLYAGSPVARHAPLVSVAEAVDLTGLPPAIILTAEYDPLRDEAERYGLRLRESGVPARIDRYDGLVHTIFGSAAAVDGARQALDDTAAMVAVRLGAQVSTEQVSTERVSTEQVSKGATR
jgi:acetyl esterase